MNSRTRRQWLTLWLPVVLAFVLVTAAWATLITIASKNPVERIEISPPEPDK